MILLRSKPPVVDKAALVSTGALVRERLLADPSVYRIPLDDAEMFAAANFLTADECAQTMAMIDQVAKPSPTYENDPNNTYRTSYSGNVDPNDTFVRMVERQICDLLGIDLSWGETMQGQRYNPGQQFKGHFDYFDTTAFYWPQEVLRGGQRSWTAMAYLNDVEEGGTTEFPELNIEIPPQKGALLIWNNARPDGEPNPKTKHAATPVVRGTKYVITKWFRTRPWC